MYLVPFMTWHNRCIEEAQFWGMWYQQICHFLFTSRLNNWIYPTPSSLQTGWYYCTYASAWRRWRRGVWSKLLRRGAVNHPYKDIDTWGLFSSLPPVTALLERLKLKGENHTVRFFLKKYRNHKRKPGALEVNKYCSLWPEIKGIQWGQTGL